MPGANVSSGVDLSWGNLLELPQLWAGAFGVNSGLGSLDALMPAAVWLPAIAVACGLLLLGITRVGLPKGLIMGAVGAVLFIYPFLILNRSGAVVGTQFQPRYILPMLFVLLGEALAPLDGLPIRLTSPQRWVLTACAIVAASMALHVELRRYVTGDDVSSPNLNVGAE